MRKDTDTNSKMKQMLGLSERVFIIKRFQKAISNSLKIVKIENLRKRELIKFTHTDE